MNRSIFFLLSALLCTVVACTPAHTVTTLQFTGYSVGKPLPNDSGMLGFLQPYAQTMNASMNKVIGFTNNTLIHKQPESALGNFLADCITQMAEKKFNRKVDAGFINQGGIRSYLAKGNITLGKIFEIMPFDNLLVLQEMKGSVLRLLLDKTAADGGWPVSVGLQMRIKEKKAIQITIAGKPLDENAVYVIANSDYVANGGSGCDMLRNLAQTNKGYLIRDAIIDYIAEFTSQGKPIDPKSENRVVYAN